jgi:hypothetical protein
MTPFEYVTVLISIILGLGITQIVTGVAEIIHAWERTKLYWPHLLWIALVFFLHIQEWWTLYDMRLYPTWRLPTFLFISLYPINLFILARILFPTFSEGPIDFKSFYFASCNKFFLGIIIAAVISILDNIFINGYSWTDQFMQFGIIAMLTFLIVKKYEAELVHKIVVITLTLTMIISLAVEWNKWLIQT